MRVPFLFAAGLSLINAVLLYFILPESRVPDPHDPTLERRSRWSELASVFQNRRFTLVTIEYFLLVTAFSFMTTAFAYYTMVKFGYGADGTGYLLAYVGVLAAVMQGLVFGKLASKFGESKLIIAGSLLLVLSLFLVPFVSAANGGLFALLLGIAGFAVGNSIASPGMTSLASKTADEAQQGKSLGILQSAASLARVIGPLACGFLLNNAVGQVDDATLYRTFWTAAAIMFAAFLTAVYFGRMHAPRAAAH
jgi:predicted MFS family arabinose efflux permease